MESKQKKEAIEKSTIPDDEMESLIREFKIKAKISE